MSAELLLCFVHAFHCNEAVVGCYSHGIEPNDFVYGFGNGFVVYLLCYGVIFEFVIKKVYAVIACGFRQVYKHVRH